MKHLIYMLGVTLLLTAPVMASAAENTAASSVDKRIEELHTKLKITKDQDALWAPVAKEMHDTADSFSGAISEREKSAPTMTAIDDLKSYADIAEMHAQSMHKFLDAFTPLYNAMTTDQKKNADVVFREHKAGKKRSGGKA